MTQLEISYHYTATPTENDRRALDSLRDIYGIRRITFNDKEKTVKVEFDASRLTEPTVASLLRRAGIDVVGEKLPRNG